jgi:hypothetical protein
MTKLKLSLQKVAEKPIYLFSKNIREDKILAYSHQTKVGKENEGQSPIFGLH